MTEPKKRGRPPKAKPEMNARVEGGAVGCAECGQAVGHYDDCAAGMGVSVPVTSIAQHQPADATVAAGVERLSKDIEADVLRRFRAQHYALRVWNGQSPEVHREERLRRVKLALDGQGLSMEGVEL